MGSYEGSRLADRNWPEKLSCCQACSAVKGLWCPSSVKEHTLQQPDVTMLIKKQLYVKSEFLLIGMIHSFAFALTLSNWLLWLTVSGINILVLVTAVIFTSFLLWAVSDWLTFICPQILKLSSSESLTEHLPYSVAYKKKGSKKKKKKRRERESEREKKIKSKGCWKKYSLEWRKCWHSMFLFLFEFWGFW